MSTDNLPQLVPMEINSRNVFISEGLNGEFISDEINIAYNPSTNAARAMFTSHVYIKQGDKYLRIQHPEGRDSDILTFQMDQFMTDVIVPEDWGPVVNPFTGKDLSDTTHLDMLTMFKAVFDYRHNKRQRDQANLAPNTPAGPGGEPAVPQIGYDPMRDLDTPTTTTPDGPQVTE